MKRTRRLMGSGLAIAAACLVCDAPEAQTAPSVTTATSAVTNACVISGTIVMAPEVIIYDKPSGGKPIGRFTGGATPLRAQNFPNHAGDLAEVATGTGTGSFRLEGFLDPAAIPVFTTRDLAVVPGHVWIGAQREVRIVGATPSRLLVEKKVTWPLRQVFRANTPCEGVALTRGTPPGWDVPGNALGYVVKEDQLDLFDSPEAERTTVTTLNLARGMLFWGRPGKAKNGLVWLEHHGEVVIEAWAPRVGLRPVPKGETEDRQPPATRVHTVPKLKLADVPREVTVGRAVVLRSAASENAPKIGVIEPDTPTYVLDVVAGWASVLPKNLHVAPPPEGQFWALASDVKAR